MLTIGQVKNESDKGAFSQGVAGESETETSTRTTERGSGTETAARASEDDAGDEISSRAVADSEFTIAIFPDTQHYSDQENGIFELMAQWVADNRSEYDIRTVLHEGDLVQHRDEEAYEWDVAEDAIGRIDSANIPTLLAGGNHDTSDLRGWPTFRERFPTSRYADMVSSSASVREYGTFEGHPENAYFVQEILGERFIFLTVEFGPRRSTLDWASTVLGNRPETTAIVVTHSYLFSDGSRTSGDDPHAPATYDLADSHTGEEMWAEFVRSNSTIASIHSGHHLGAPYVAHRSDANNSGERVSQQYVNYQDMTGNGGDGWFRLLTVDTDTYEAKVNTYSPYLDEWSGDDSEQFQFMLSRATT